MLNPRKRLLGLYPRKLGREDLVRAKNFVKNNINGPITRSIVAIINDFSTTYGLSSVLGPDGEFNPFARELMEGEGVKSGLLKHQMNFTPFVYGLTLGLWKLENKMNDPKWNNFWRKFYKKHILSSLILDSMSAVKYCVSINNAINIVKSSNPPEPWNTLSSVSIPIVLGIPYVLSLGKYYSEKLGISFREEVKYATKKLLDGYERAAYKLGIQMNFLPKNRVTNKTSKIRNDRRVAQTETSVNAT